MTDDHHMLFWNLEVNVGHVGDTLSNFSLISRSQIEFQMKFHDLELKSFTNMTKVFTRKVHVIHYHDCWNFSTRRFSHAVNDRWSASLFGQLHGTLEGQYGDETPMSYLLELLLTWLRCVTMTWPMITTSWSLYDQITKTYYFLSFLPYLCHCRNLVY